MIVFSWVAFSRYDCVIRYKLVPTKSAAAPLKSHYVPDNSPVAGVI